MKYIFKNDFGELYKNRISIQINNKIQTIDFDNLVRIQYVKRRKLHMNYLAVVSAVYLFFYIVNNTFSYMIQLIISLFAVLFLAASYFYKSFQYRFVIIKKNYQREVNIKKKMSFDAEEFASQINKILVQ